MAVVGLKVSEIDLGKKLGFERFQAKLCPARNLCIIQLVIQNSYLRGMSPLAWQPPSAISKLQSQITLQVQILLFANPNWWTRNSTTQEA